MCVTLGRTGVTSIWRELGVFLFATLLAGCGGEEPEAYDVPDPVVLPQLLVEAPERGAFFGQQGVEVRGVATAGSADLASLTVNGEEIALDADGRFDDVIPVAAGVGILSFRLEDVDGERAVDGRAVHWGETYEPEFTLAEAVFLHLGAEQLDDNASDVDDAAALIELALQDESITDSLVGTPSEQEYFTVTPTAFTLGSASADIVPTDSELQVDLILSDVSMDFDVDGVGWYDWVSTDGSAWMDTVTVSLALEVQMSGGEVEVEMAGSAVSFDGFGLTVDYFPDTFEDELADWVQEDIEDGLEETAVAMVQDLLAEFLQEMAFSFDIGESAPQVHVSVALADIEVSEAGVTLAMDGSVWGDSVLSLPENAGSLHTVEPSPAWPMSGDLLTVALDDDFANQLFFSMWSAGFLTDIVMDGIALAALTGTELEAPLGPVAEMALRVDLPPVIAQTAIEERMADVSLGELRMIIERTDGERLDFSVSARTAFTVDMQADASFDADLDARPSYVEVADMVAHRVRHVGCWDGLVEDGAPLELQPLHASAVREALGALIPARLHRRHDDAVRKGKSEFGPLRGGSMLYMDGWRVSVRAEDALAQGRLQEDALELFFARRGPLVREAGGAIRDCK